MELFLLQWVRKIRGTCLGQMTKTPLTWAQDGSHFPGPPHREWETLTEGSKH